MPVCHDCVSLSEAAAWRRLLSQAGSVCGLVRYSFPNPKLKWLGWLSVCVCEAQPIVVYVHRTIIIIIIIKQTKLCEAGSSVYVCIPRQPGMTNVWGGWGSPMKHCAFLGVCAENEGVSSQPFSQWCVCHSTFVFSKLLLKQDKMETLPVYFGRLGSDMCVTYAPGRKRGIKPVWLLPSILLLICRMIF